MKRNLVERLERVLAVERGTCPVPSDETQPLFTVMFLSRFSRPSVELLIRVAEEGWMWRGPVAGRFLNTGLLAPSAGNPNQLEITLRGREFLKAWLHYRRALIPNRSK